ncbi:hypothetical protein [Roseospira goensis]|uniref:Uncharacterized protein n=1 Tax=Roseospira goensis TaxID=391922 RepID=A0A7W6RXE4_9PROT|nr:hypothetical protein [Roseospira goensis]MBB4284973.1 hypothetical protein [Roseospira goensis]
MMFDLAESEIKEIDDSLEPALAWAKDRRAQTEQLALDATRLLSCVEDRFEDYKSQGFFKRCWSTFSGKNSAIERANQSDLSEMQKYAWRYLALLQERELLAAQSMVVIKNNLLALSVGQEDIRNEIVRLADRIYDRFNKLEDRVTSLEVGQSINGWVITLDRRGYEKRYPSILRLLRIVHDFYAMKPSSWTAHDLLLLEKALDIVGLDPDSHLSIETLVGNLIDELELNSIDIFNSLTSPPAKAPIEGVFAIEHVSSPLFNSIFQLRENYGPSGKHISRLAGHLSCTHADAMKITIIGFIEDSGIDKATNYSLRDFACEILFCYSLVERLYLSAVDGTTVTRDQGGEGKDVESRGVGKLQRPSQKRRDNLDINKVAEHIRSGLRSWKYAPMITCEKRFIFGDQASQKQLTNAKNSVGVPSEEEIVFIIDTSLFGNAKEGLVCTGRGLYVIGSGSGFRITEENDVVDLVEKFVGWDFLGQLFKNIASRQYAVGDDDSKWIVVDLKKDIIIGQASLVMSNINSGLCNIIIERACELYYEFDSTDYP